MKKIITVIICLLASKIILAQAADPAYKDYVGKYIFGPGNPVSEVDVLLQDTSLAVSTRVTEVIVLKKLGNDSFAVNVDGATSVAFKRETSGQVNGLLLYTISGRTVSAKKQKPIDAAIIKKQRFPFSREMASAAGQLGKERW